MSKRSHGQAFADDDDVLRIQLANDAEQPQIQADRAVVKLFSSCARGLPADAEEWDLSNVLIDGQPVTRPVVVAWLNRAYMCSYAEQFEEQQDDPAASMEGLYQLLAFADAIGTTKPVLQACVSQLDKLKLHVQLGEQHIQLATVGQFCYFNNNPMQLFWTVLTSSDAHDEKVGEPAASAEQKQAFLNQVQQQIEQLLFMAYKLQLAPLLDRLHAFVRSHMFINGSIVPHTACNEVFSSRVLDAALGPNQLGKEAWLRSVLSEPSGLAARSGKQQLFEPINLTEEQQQPIEFEAKLVRDVMGMPKGSIVHVKVRLFGDSIDIGAVTGVPASLHILGPS